MVVFGCVLALLAFTAPFASADTLSLYDWTFNVNGATFNPPDLPINFDTSGLAFSTGLGSITASIITAGSHLVIGYFDHDVTSDNNSYDNEYGYVSGSPKIGQSWEIDEPGYTVGDLVPNVLAGTLHNMILNGAGSGPQDIAMALGWESSLASDQRAKLGFAINTSAPASVFYLRHRDLLLKFFGRRDRRAARSA